MPAEADCRPPCGTLAPMNGSPAATPAAAIASPAEREWNRHRLTEAEEAAFTRDGFLVLPDRLPEAVTDGLEEAFDAVIAAERVALGAGELDRLNVFDFLGRDDRLLEMIDWPATFPKVLDLLGWNIQIYHSHMIVTPGAGQGADPGTRHWHQDSDRLNHELETTPQPRVSLKVAFFLTDCSEPGRGNFAAVPGSHLDESAIDRRAARRRSAGGDRGPGAARQRSCCSTAASGTPAARTMPTSRARRCSTATATAGCARATT